MNKITYMLFVKSIKANSKYRLINGCVYKWKYFLFAIYLTSGYNIGKTNKFYIYNAVAAHKIFKWLKSNIISW